MDQARKQDISDIIDDKIIPVEGSIKVVRIDGMLDSKQIYMKDKWKHICRYPDCIKETVKAGLCVEHRSYQIKNNINLEKIYRTTTNIQRDLSRYMWSSKQEDFILLCSSYLCPKPASRKDQKSVNFYLCKEHSTTSLAVYSSHQSTVNFFYQLKNEYNLSSMKDRIKSKDPSRPIIEVKEFDNEKFKQNLI